ncbi:MAG: NUDIX domain-containing protein [Caldilineaceae bacterium]|nr:NUDIX domain-containing protein [Caldilineaceae bacterium]HRJ45560.1 NUDIX domain-containing protein [Caldilineaceae bacterium]
MNRIIRYQGAIVRDGQILLIRQRQHDTGESYWLFPGGGREEGETEDGCVQREMWEETNLHVSVERLLLDEPTESGAVYTRRRTFLCTVLAGVAAPGYEPEEDAAASYGIVEVGWFDLADESGWPVLVKEDNITYPQLLGVQRALGYL